jgi:hypothetical protein
VRLGHTFARSGRPVEVSHHQAALGLQDAGGGGELEAFANREAVQFPDRFLGLAEPVQRDRQSVPGVRGLLVTGLLLQELAILLHRQFVHPPLEHAVAAQVSAGRCVRALAILRPRA